MTVSADQRNEILQTIKSLLVQIRREQDCVSCHCYLYVEAEEVVLFEQEWKTYRYEITEICEPRPPGATA